MSPSIGLITLNAKFIHSSLSIRYLRNVTQQEGFDNKMVTLEVFDISDADALGNNAVYSDGKVIGRATGGNYGFRVKKSLAIAMVKPEFSKIGTELEMDILDKKHKVDVIEDSPYDPTNEKIRV